jgi:hypothetical protein
LESESWTWLWDEISSKGASRSKPLRVGGTLRTELGENLEARYKWIACDDVAKKNETSGKVEYVRVYNGPGTETNSKEKKERMGG